jgi:peptidoglycan/xylan/chitin deacetylase (PgdA/CDA1 family)
LIFGVDLLEWVWQAMPLTLLYDQLRSRFPSAFWRGNSERREIALTFDDGPDAKSTPALLALLERYQVKATFFQIGARASSAPQLVQQVAAAGHQIGLHGYQHQSFLLKDSKTLLGELAKAQRVIADASGGGPENFNAVRPPFGHFTPAILDTLSSASYLPTMWSVVPFHWLQSAEMTKRQILAETKNGTILVLHEALPGPAVVDLTEAVLPKLLDEGYRFLTIHEMWTNLQQKSQ